MLMLRDMRFRHLFSLLMAAQTLVPATAALSTHTPRKNAAIAPPSQDPFYAAPSGLEKKSAGTVLAHRRSPSPVFAFGYTPDNIQDSYQVLYRTTDRDDRPTATVMTVLVPKNANFSSVLSFQLAENAVIIDCAPSYAITAASRDDPLFNSLTAQLQVLLIQAALADGWVVVVPDFQGPRAAFADMKIAGQAILDGLRASLRSESFTGVSETAVVALWGYSAGAAVTKFAAEMQPKYANELDLVGVAFGGVGQPSLDAVKKMNRSPHAGLLPPALIGVGLENPEFQMVLDLTLKREFKEKFYAPLHQCLDANIKTFANADVLGMFHCLDLCVLPALALVQTKSLRLSSPVPRAPVYWYQEVHDDVAPVNGTDAAVQDYCKRGARVHYQKDDAVGIGHLGYGIIGAPNALGWLKGMRDGKQPDAECVTETVTVSELPESFLNIFPASIRPLLVASLINNKSGKKVMK
ncbi:hypothetical protein C2857_007132 [Epichloe festucae Fl1]|uniref:Secretory lipase n=1 Tax=Epichloe festucae (strain Fl1) TaxID=877507 RepID=A0A7S9KQJ4_EPIFF|nr:hypothetical protein C2857_007132 [Epichloe festucae Fl1]